MKNAPLILILFFLNCLQAQVEKSTKMGLATLEEAKMSVYSKDSTASAVVLYEHANVYLDPNFDYNTRTDYYFRIKILNKSAFDLSKININLYKENRVVDIKAATYNLSEVGALSKTIMDDKAVFTVEQTENWTIKKFTLPNIKEGSIIEYSYSIISPYLGIKDWYFQSDIPKLKSEFDAAILGNYKFNIRITGALKLDKNNTSLKKGCIYIEGLGDGDCGIYSYGMYNIPAFKEEDYMLSKKNYISRLSFDLKTYTSPRGVVTNYTTSWKEADKKLKRIFFNNQTSKKRYFKKRIPENIIANKDQLQKAKEVFNFIKNHYTWNDQYWNSEDEQVKDAFDDKVGSAGEINISLYNSLAAADIDCNLIVLSTRNNGIPTKLYPVIFDFNYVIVKANINNKTYFLDATDKVLPFGQLPERCLNSNARVINFKANSNWVTLKPLYKTSKNTKAELVLNEDGQIVGNLEIRSQGYEAINKRKKIFSIREEQYLENFETEYPDTEVDNYSVQFLENLDKPLVEEFKVNIFTLEELANTIRINPFIYERISKNPFKLKERNYPVDFAYSRKNNFYLSLEIPKNYSIKSLPTKRAFDLPNRGGRFILSVSQKDNIINIYTRLNINKNIFNPQEYASLKQFFNNIIMAEKSSIVIEKRK